MQKEKYFTFGLMRQLVIFLSPKNGQKKNGKNWEDYWQSNDSDLIHFIGKDNIVFHCIIFPAMMKAHGKNYIMPTNVPAFEF